MTFFSKEEALEIHRLNIERFGGPAGLLDEGKFESALIAQRVATTTKVLM